MSLMPQTNYMLNLQHLFITPGTNMTVEQYISGFHSRLDKVASLKFDNNLKGHIVLHQAVLPTHEKTMLVGAASGSYDILHLTEELRNAFINHNFSHSTMK